MTPSSSRQNIYYWKCDRAAAFHGTAQNEARQPRAGLVAGVGKILTRYFGRAPATLRDGGGQGNHLTFVAEVGGAEYFVRVEDGPERDDYIAVESCVLAKVRTHGVPTPLVHATDASRSEVPFAWQILENVPHPDLNRHFKAGTLDGETVAEQIGRLIGTWQAVPVEGFGPFDASLATFENRLRGLHPRSSDYFFTRLDDHLAFLVDRKFLPRSQAREIRREIERCRSVLDEPQGCLVHKDLALWNLLGTEREVRAVIDWDDCIAGDPMDDLSLLACFHNGTFLRRAFAGYASVRPLPPEYVSRFWLHLLRNMIFKAVIRVGAGYFNLNGNFFLLGSGASGAALRNQTLDRIALARRGLQEGSDPFSL